MIRVCEEKGDLELKAFLILAPTTGMRKGETQPRKAGAGQHRLRPGKAAAFRSGETRSLRKQAAAQSAPPESPESPRVSYRATGRIFEPEPAS
jgi:hypothetical protein